MPFVKPEIVQHLFSVGEKMGCDALIPKHRYPEPLLAYYSKRSLHEIETAIKRGIRKILDAYENLNTVFYPVENLRKFDMELLSFFNINTPEDLRRAEELCSQMNMVEL
jgi:molybdopterin-guanine dinucleotide biosynthesis protein A